MPITPSALRADIYNILDQVLETGEEVEIVRKGRVVRLVPQQKKSVLSRLMRRENVINGDPDDLIHMDWSHEWKG